MKAKKRFLISTAVILLALVTAVIMIRSRARIEQVPVTFPPPLVRVEAVEIQDSPLIVRSQGTVSPHTETELVTQVAGEIISVAPQFAVGGFFNRGDILMEIDRRDYEFALSRIEAEVAQARLQLAQEEQEAEIAREEWEQLGRSESAHPLVLREPQLARAKAQLAAAEAAFQQSRLNLERTWIKAPYDGRVRVKLADVGQYVTPGTRLGTIYAIDYVEVMLPVPDDQMAYLDCFLDYRTQKPADLNIRVKIYANYGGRDFSWTGKIVRVSGEIDPQTHMIILVARVDDPYSRNGGSERPPLAVGMFVEGEIQGKTARGVAVLPRAVLRGENRVLVVDNEDRLRFRTVEVLRTDAGSVIISSGLHPEERVCISSIETVVDGMKVRVVGENEQSLDSENGNA